MGLHPDSHEIRSLIYLSKHWITHQKLSENLCITSKRKSYGSTLEPMRLDFDLCSLVYLKHSHFNERIASNSVKLKIYSNNNSNNDNNNNDDDNLSVDAKFALPIPHAEFQDIHLQSAAVPSNGNSPKSKGGSPVGVTKPTLTFSVSQKELRSASVSPDGSKIASTTKDGVLYVHNLSTGQLIGGFKVCLKILFFLFSLLYCLCVSFMTVDR